MMGVNSNLLFTISVTSIILSLIAVVPHDAFAMGQAYGTCTNEYDGTIISFTINNGSQTFDPIVHPGVTFNVYDNSDYSTSFVIHTISESLNNNTNPGDTWYDTDTPGFAAGVCVGNAGPNENVAVNGGGSSYPSEYQPGGTATQSVFYGTWANSSSYNQVAFNVHWIPPPTSSSAPTVPSAPTGLTATPGNAKISLSWTAPSSNGGSAITSYNVYRGTTSGGETLLAKTGNMTSYTDTAVSSGSTYYYRVTAVNSVGESPQSNEASADPPAPSITLSPYWQTCCIGELSVKGNVQNQISGISQMQLLIYAPNGNLVFNQTESAGGFQANYMISRSDGKGNYTITGMYDGMSKKTSIASIINNDPYPIITGISEGTSGAFNIGWQIQYGISSDEVSIKVINQTNSTVASTIQEECTQDTCITSLGPFSKSGNYTTIVTLPYNNATAKTISAYTCETASCTTTKTIPSAPQNLQATASDSQVTLSWQTPSSNGGSTITGYDVYRGTTSGGELTTPIGTVSSSTLSYNDTAVTNGQAYYYKITAVNSVGQSAQSNEASADPTAPPPPSPTQATISVNSVDLCGNPITGLWSVIRYTNGTTITSSYTPASFSVMTGTTYVVHVGNYGSDVFNHWSNGNTTSYYTITPTQSATLTAYYSTGSTCTSTTATAPGAPTGLAATTGNSQVSLSWTAPASNGGSAVTGYNVYRGTTSGGESSIPIATGITTTTYTDTGLTNGQAYYYTIKAVNSVGTGTASNEASATPMASATAPSAPQNLVAAAGNAQVSLSWAAPSSNGGSAITSYNVYRGTSSGVETSLASVSGSTTSYTDTAVTNGITYYYYVTATNSAGTSPQSNETSATPTAPSGNSGSTGGIALNNVQSTSGTTDSSNQMTISSFNAGSGTDQLLVVGISANNQGATTVTFNGQPLTQAVSSFTNNDAEFWYLKNPTGTGNVVATFGGQTQAVVGVYSFANVNQTSPIANTAKNSNTASSSPSISITTKYANDWVLDLPAIYGGQTLGSPTCTQEWNTNIQSAITGASSSTTVSSPSSVTCGWTANQGGDMWDDVAVELKAAS